MNRRHGFLFIVAAAAAAVMMQCVDDVESVLKDADGCRSGVVHPPSVLATQPSVGPPAGSETAFFDAFRT